MVAVARDRAARGERGGDGGTVAREPTSDFQSTSSSELVFRALLDEDGNRDVCFGRVAVGPQ